MMISKVIRKNTFLGIYQYLFIPPGNLVGMVPCQKAIRIKINLAITPHYVYTRTAAPGVDWHTKRQVLYKNALEYNVYQRCLCYMYFLNQTPMAYEKDFIRNLSCIKKENHTLISFETCAVYSMEHRKVIWIMLSQRI